MSAKEKKLDLEPCWIDTLDISECSEEVRGMYDEVGAVHGRIHNLYRAFSLQPAPLVSADKHYRDILHNRDNKSEPWFLELLASQAAIIAKCDYALTNHGDNFRVLLGNDQKATRLLEAVVNGDFSDRSLLSEKHAALLIYGEKLCRTPDKMTQADIVVLREAGATDTEILEAVQSTSCFAYWVRFINALGIQIGGEAVGMYDDSGNKRG